MLIAVLVLALFGLWTPIVAALVLVQRIEITRLEETVAEGGINMRLTCDTCGAHTLRPIALEPRDARATGTADPWARSRIDLEGG